MCLSSADLLALDGGALEDQGGLVAEVDDLAVRTFRLKLFKIFKKLNLALIILLKELEKLPKLFLLRGPLKDKKISTDPSNVHNTTYGPP